MHEAGKRALALFTLWACVLFMACSAGSDTDADTGFDEDELEEVGDWQVSEETEGEDTGADGTATPMALRRPDFRVTSITFSPNAPVAGSQFKATLTVKNRGSASGSAGRLAVWADRTGAPTCGDMGEKGIFVGQLAPGASRTFTVSNLSAGPAGNRTFRAFVDSRCRTTEINETNNQSAKVYVVSGTGSAGVCTAAHGKILAPNGSPIKLCGYRIQSGDYSNAKRRLSLSEIQAYGASNLLGTGQAVEIWYSDERGDPGEASPIQPGIYNEEALEPLLSFMRDLAKAGQWIIPSIRVSYDQVAARDYTARGIKPNVQKGWADHAAVIRNDPVVVTTGPNKGTYGKHRDRFFAWLDWLLPKILADKEVASRIAYWETWHYCGHRHSIPADVQDRYVDEFVPLLLAKYRKHDPHRLLGASLVANDYVNEAVSRVQAGHSLSWESDPNWLAVIGGYGRLGIIMRPDNFVPNFTNWPEDSNNPEWLPASNEFNIQKLVRLRPDITLHSQEGPGLRETFRTTPIPPLQREWLRGLLDLYNGTTNGFGFHSWPPSWENLDSYRFGKPTNFNEQDFFQLMRRALRGDPT